ncbi:MAG: ABC transporter ATP-binding protein [Lachnospiraceae bacterium]|nr:ABC transporter ATP-binding protein [Lachnospiraceae bacterium]
MELRVENVTKEFKEVRAVDGINCRMEKGVYGLLGVNGAGKTTFMRMLCTLLPPTEGTIFYNGKDIFEMGAEYRGKLGYLPQEFGYYPDFTVKDYLLYIASIKGVNRAVAKKKVNMLLSKVGLSKVQNRKMKKLSGGMKRRAGIAQAMLNDPEILILDEPTAGLDPSERIRFRNLISELASERLVILSTHIVSDIEYIANQILLMKEGALLHSGTLSQVIAEVGEKVWSVEVPIEQAHHYLKKYKVVNVRNGDGTAHMRILAGQMPCPGARQEELTLEDVFLHYFGETAGEDDAEI